MAYRFGETHEGGVDSTGLVNPSAPVRIGGALDAGMCEGGAVNVVESRHPGVYSACYIPHKPSRRGNMPESGLPIRVYKDDDMWHVDYGEGVVEDHDSEEEAESAADAVAEADERTVVVEEHGD